MKARMNSTFVKLHAVVDTMHLAFANFKMGLTD